MSAACHARRRPPNQRLAGPADAHNSHPHYFDLHAAPVLFSATISSNNLHTSSLAYKCSPRLLQKTLQLPRQYSRTPCRSMDQSVIRYVSSRADRLRLSTTLPTNSQSATEDIIPLGLPAMSQAQASEHLDTRVRFGTLTNATTFDVK